MQAKHYRWIFLPIAVAVFISGFFKSDDTTIGASSQWVNGQYHFAGGTQPWALMVAIGLIGFYLFLMFSPPTTLGRPIPGVFRRFVAFWIDFLIAVLGIAPLLGIVPTLLEWHRTGEFQWTFERDTFASYDLWITLSIVLTMFAILAFYYAWPLARKIPSPGACVMGYQIVHDGGIPMPWSKALLRTLLGFIAVCGCYVAPFILRDKKRGKFWLDAIFKTHAQEIV